MRTETEFETLVVLSVIIVVVNAVPADVSKRALAEKTRGQEFDYNSPQCNSIHLLSLAYAFLRDNI